MIDPFLAITAGIFGGYIYTVLMVGVTISERLAGDTRRSFPLHFLYNFIGWEG